MNDEPLSVWQAWLSLGSPWWDACACGHPRWTHFDGSCDRHGIASHYKRLCGCKAFALAQVAA